MRYVCLKKWELSTDSSFLNMKTNESWFCWSYIKNLLKFYNNKTIIITCNNQYIVFDTITFYSSRALNKTLFTCKKELYFIMKTPTQEHTSRPHFCCCGEKKQTSNLTHCKPEPIRRCRVYIPHMECEFVSVQTTQQVFSEYGKEKKKKRKVKRFSKASSERVTQAYTR